jgi:integrase/recombinase XerD
MNRPSMASKEFASPVGHIMADFISEKRALGFHYQTGAEQLRLFDRFLKEKGLDACALPKEFVKEWVCKRTSESRSTQRDRFRLTRQFAEFMSHRGWTAYIPDIKLEPVAQSNFVPYIFTHNEIARLLTAADHLSFCPVSPIWPIVAPELFRVLYGCGLRLGEALRLTVADTDLAEGVLTIRESKFRKDRLVPMAPELTARLRSYQELLGKRSPNAYLFPRHTGKSYTRSGIYAHYRKILTMSGITHGGKGKGPRLHDLRHAFALHRLLAWYQQGGDLTSKLPVLSTYMGHRNMIGTQHYLHLTLELLADLSIRLDAQYGLIIPERNDP